MKRSDWPFCIPVVPDPESVDGILSDVFAQFPPADVEMSFHELCLFLGIIFLKLQSTEQKEFIETFLKNVLTQLSHLSPLVFGEYNVAADILELGEQGLCLVLLAQHLNARGLLETTYPLIKALAGLVPAHDDPSDMYTHLQLIFEKIALIDRLDAVRLSALLNFFTEPRFVNPDNMRLDLFYLFCLDGGMTQANYDRLLSSENHWIFDAFILRWEAADNSLEFFHASVLARLLDLGVDGPEHLDAYLSELFPSAPTSMPAPTSTPTSTPTPPPLPPSSETVGDSASVAGRYSVLSAGASASVLPFFNEEEDSSGEESPSEYSSDSDIDRNPGEYDSNRFFHPPRPAAPDINPVYPAPSYSGAGRRQ